MLLVNIGVRRESYPGYRLKKIERWKLGAQLSALQLRPAGPLVLQPAQDELLT